MRGYKTLLAVLLAGACFLLLVAATRADGGNQTKPGQKGGESRIGVQLGSDSNISARLVAFAEELEFGSGTVELDTPGDMALAWDGRLLLTDIGTGEILVVNGDLEVEEIIGNTSRSTVHVFWISSVRDIGVDSIGRIHILDSESRAFHTLGPDFEYLGSTEVMPHLPYTSATLAVDSQDHVLLGYYGGHGDYRVLVYSENLSTPGMGSMGLVTSFELCPPGQGESDAHGSIRDIAVDSKGRILAVEAPSMFDQDILRIVVVDPEYRTVDTIGFRGEEPGGFVGLSGIAVGPGDTITASDPGTSRVSFFFPNGTYAGRIGTSGKDPGEFERPGAVVVSRSGEMYVSDHGSDMLQLISLDWDTLHPAPVGEPSHSEPPDHNVPEPVALMTGLVSLICLKQIGHRETV